MSGHVPDPADLGSARLEELVSAFLRHRAVLVRARHGVDGRGGARVREAALGQLATAAEIVERLLGDQPRAVWAALVSGATVGDVVEASGIEPQYVFGVAVGGTHALAGDGQRLDDTLSVQTLMRCHAEAAALEADDERVERLRSGATPTPTDTLDDMLTAWVREARGGQQDGEAQP